MNGRKLVTLTFALTAAIAAFAAPSKAGFFPAQAIDGPAAEIISVGEVDVARDGQGAVTYLRNDGGVPHVFVARFISGAFTAPSRLDAGLSAAASQPVVAAADNGRLAAAFVSGGTLHASVFDPGTGAWTTPQAIAEGASGPSLDLSIHGAGFLVYTVAGDVRAARLERAGTAFTVLGSVLDLDPTQAAGQGAGRPRVAIGADSTAIAAWGENGRVIARRLYRTSISVAPADLTLTELEGRAGLAADLPEVAIEDDSSFVQIAFRQAFQDGQQQQTRVVTRRLRGSAVDPASIVDGASWGAPSAVGADIDINGRGEGGTATVLADGSVAVGILKDDRFSAGSIIGGPAAGGLAPKLISSETTQRVASWLHGDGTARSRFYDDRRDVRSLPSPGPETVVSDPALGPVDPAGGLEAASNRVGDFMAVFVQGSGAERRLVYSVYDRAPVAFSLYTRSAWRNPNSAPLTWSSALDLWGGATYIVSIDGREVGRTEQTSLTIPQEALVPDGVRSWRVTAVDRRGQTVSTAARPLRLDSVAPEATIGFARRKRTVTVTVRASDVLPPSGRASGVKLVKLDMGDGSPKLTARRATRTYRGTRRVFTITAEVTDAAGNTTIVERDLRLPKVQRRAPRT